MDIFGGAPRIRAYPRPVTVPCGADATLTCRITGDPRPNVAWERNGKRLPVGGRYHPSESDDVYSLTIAVATPEDAGQYVCKIRNSVGEAYAAATLRVEGEPENRGLPVENGHSTGKDEGNAEDKASSRKNRDTILRDRKAAESIQTKNNKEINHNEDDKMEERGTPRNKDTILQKDLQMKDRMQAGVSRDISQKEENRMEERVTTRASMDSILKEDIRMEERVQNRDHRDINLREDGNMEERMQIKDIHMNEEVKMVKKVQTTDNRDPILKEDVKMEDIKSSMEKKDPILKEDVEMEEKKSCRNNKVTSFKEDVKMEEDNSSRDNKNTSFNEDVKMEERAQTRVTEETKREEDSKIIEGIETKDKHLKAEDKIQTNEGILKEKCKTEERGSLMDNTNMEMTVKGIVQISNRNDEITLLKEEDNTKESRLINDNGHPNIKDKAEVEEVRPPIEMNGYKSEKMEGSKPEEEAEPRILIRPLSARVRVGDDTAFSCKLWGLPPPEVTWEKDGRQLDEIFESTHYSVGQQDGGWFQVSIFGVRVPDGGVYTCRARNASGEVLASGMLLVDKPSIDVQGDYGSGLRGSRSRHRGLLQKDDPLLNPSKVKKFTVTEGKHAKFRCFVSGKPKPDIVWKKDGQLIAAGRRHLLYEDREGYFTLKVLYCRQQDNGTYVCAASNMAGHTLSAVHLSVKEPRVRFWQHLRDVEVRERDLAVLECEVAEEASPVTWYLEDRRLHPDTKYGMEQWGRRRRLTIRDVGPDDDGVYLCEMPDGGRSIAELAVRGAIVRRLPRRLEVLEGENAAFCVEVAEDEMDVRWQKDCFQLRDSHRTIIKSFGKTHILVFVNTTPQDSGMVSFTVGRSRTTAKLRVKAARHAAPSCPAEARMSLDHSNVALLSWVPAHDVSKIPASAYVVERQEVGSHEWVQCLTTDCATLVEVPGDNVPSEADYRFRVCSVNKYGRSGHVEFRGTVHLVPTVRIEVPLQDIVVRSGKDARFTLQLSATLPGVWHCDGIEVKNNNRFSAQQSGSCHSLMIHGAAVCDDGVKVTFTAAGVKDSAFLRIQAPVKFTPLLETDTNKCVEAGQPIVLYCELSDPVAPVHWYKDGVELRAEEGLIIQSEGNMRRVIIESADSSHSGVYSCDADDDVTKFKVDVEAPLPRFVQLPENEKSVSFEAGDPIILQCEVTNPNAQVSWYKDGTQLFPQTGVDIQSEGTVRRLIVQSADPSHSGNYSCSIGDDVLRFQVDIQAPPVTFMDMPKEDLHKRVVELDPLVLFCEASRPDAEVRWYKDGVDLNLGDNRVTTEASGTARRLIIQSTQASDSGTYTCWSGDNEVLFTVHIREPPAMIVHPKEDVQLNMCVSDEVVLSCELSRSRAMVTWYKDGQKLQEGEEVQMKSEGPYRRLIIPYAALEHSGEYVCDTADDSAFFQLCITEAPVCIVCPSQSHMELCQQVSEPLVLSCEISKAEAEVCWYRDGLQVKETDSLFLEVDRAYRRLILPAVTIQDSGQYTCETANDSVTFIVNITEPPVTFAHPAETTHAMEGAAGNPMVLRCEVSHAGARVTWMKNGREIQGSDTVKVTEDGIFRQLTLLSPTVEDSGKYVCNTKDDSLDFQVKITEPPVKILRKGEMKTKFSSTSSDDIVLECELSRASGSVTWYKDGERIDEDERFCYEEEGAFRSLVILSAELTDTGEYICDAGDDFVVFNITVKEPPVAILSNSINRQEQCLVAGDELILSCEVSRPDATVHWYCNDRLLCSDSRTTVESYGTIRKLILRELGPSDSGRYTCDAIDDKMVTMVKVEEPPVQFLGKGEVNLITGYESESVTMTALVSRENATVCWMRDWTPVAGDRFHIGSEGTTRLLTIDPLQRSDSGEYTCDADADRMHFSLLVKEMRVKFVKPLEDMVAHQNGLVTLRCELNKLRGDVLWLKDGVEIVPSRRFAIRADGTERTLTIHRLTAEDAGEYACESKDDRTQAALTVELPRVVEFLVELHNTTVMEGEDATFRCVVSPEDVQLMWYRDGEPIGTDDKRMTMSSNGLCHVLHIGGCQLTDSGRVSVDAEGTMSKAALKVQEAQVLFTKKMGSAMAEEYSEATLEVEVNVEAAEVQWMRHGVVIQPGPKYTLTSDGHRRSLTIHALAISDRGTYCCETLHDRTQGKLNVESRKITISKGLTDTETFERETASFEVGLSHADVEGVWQKDGLRLKPNQHTRISAKGRVHSLTLSTLSLEDTGTITFSAEGARSSARLTVVELPVMFLRKPEDLSFPEDSLASIECELSRPNADVKWLKNGVELKPAKNHRIYSLGRKRFLQILKCEASDSGIYMCDAGDANASCTLAVYERKVEIVQELVDADIQEDENAVFMCEVSRDDVPGEWFWNEERIRPNSTIKIRKEGTKHFLLMCNVKSEDSGEIKFVAKEAESIAYLDVEELPVAIVKPLRDRSALERHRVILECTVSTARANVRWYRGDNEIAPSERFEMHSDGCYHKLVIQQLRLEDEGTYSVCVGEHTSSARLMVEAQSMLMVRELEDVEVVAPGEACFECEVSVPATRDPVWSLNGETLRPGPRVRMESLGTVYRLVLSSTATDMEGSVTFAVGKAKSSARLQVTTQ